MKPSNEQMTEIKFEQLGDFSAVNAARNWLSEHGYSYGSMCMDMPIGILKGDWYIAKWRNLTRKEREQLDGQMTSRDFRSGPVVIQLKATATNDEIETGNRIKQDIKDQSVIDNFITDGGFDKAFNDVFGLPLAVAESLKEVS